MKAKYTIGILSVILLSCFPLKGQLTGMNDYRNNDARIVVNNYYDDYDYYFSSRINRFHRSYCTFNYYAPVFTESYWYNYQPYSWGVSIYGGSGFGLTYNYPVYNYGYGYDYGWYDPYYGSSYYWGYDPFYYSWYNPVIINFRIGNHWSNNYYGWNSHNNRYNYHNNYYNNYYSNNYQSNRYYSNQYSSNRRPGTGTRYNDGYNSKRDISTSSSSRTQTDRRATNDKSNNGLHMGDVRRNENPTVNRGLGNNNTTNRRVNNGNNNGNNGNSGNVGNSGTNGNNNNENRNNNVNNTRNNPNLNNGINNNANRYQNQNPVRNQNQNNIRPNTGNNSKSAITNQPERRVQEQSPARNQGAVNRNFTPSRSQGNSSGNAVRSAPARNSSSSGSGTTGSAARRSSSASQSKSSSSNSSSSRENSRRR